MDKFRKLLDVLKKLVNIIWVHYFTLFYIFLITLLIISLLLSDLEWYVRFILFLFLSTLFLLIKPKLFFSKNIIFMSLYTYFSIPLIFTLIIILIFKINIVLSFFIIVIMSCVYFFVLYFVHFKDSEKKISFLNNSKISLDITRLSFVTLLAVTAIYAKTLDDFSTFTKHFTNLEDQDLNDVRVFFQLTFQTMSLPFIFSTTLIKIIIDYISTRK